MAEYSACPNCGRGFITTTGQHYCSGVCQDAVWRRWEQSQSREGTESPQPNPEKE